MVSIHSSLLSQRPGIAFKLLLDNQFYYSVSFVDINWLIPERDTIKDAIIVCVTAG